MRRLRPRFPQARVALAPIVSVRFGARRRALLLPLSYREAPSDSNARFIVGTERSWVGRLGGGSPGGARPSEISDCGLEFRVMEHTVPLLCQSEEMLHESPIRLVAVMLEPVNDV